MKVATPVKVALAFTNRLLTFELPISTLPKAFSVLPEATVTGAVAMTGAAKIVLAWTASALLGLVPSTVLPKALKLLPVATVSGALAVIAAEKVVAALMVKL